MFLDRLQAPCAWVASCAAAAAAAGLLTSALAGAQPSPAGAASAPTPEMTPTERARRDADRVFKWILIHSDKPRKASPAHDERRDEKPAGATRAKRVGRAAEPALAAPAVAEVTGVPAQAATPEPEAPVPVPVAATPPPLDTAFEPVASAATRVAPATVPDPAPVDDRDEVLRPLIRTEPKFPPSLLRTLGKGQVQVRFTVRPDGSVVEPSVTTMSDSRLRPAALAAVAQSRFAPLRKAQTGVVDLVFNLE